jgi:hypothetical protein
MQLIHDDLTLDLFPPSSFGKTSPEFSTPRTTPLDAFLVHLPVKMRRLSQQGSDGQTLVVCMAPKEQLRGGSLTPNISEWPNDAAVCSLSQVLETTSIPQRFFLSPRACAGILRRAEKRGKELPPALQTALLFSRTGNERVEAEAMVLVAATETVGALCADTHLGAYSGQDAYTGRLIPQIVGAIDCRIGAQRAQNAQAGHMLPIPIHDQATRHAGKNGEKTMGKGNGLGIGQPGDPMNTLTNGDRHAVAQPIVYERHDQDARLKEVSVAPTLHAKSDNTCDLPVVLHPNTAVAYNISPGKGELKDDIHVTDAHVSKTIDASNSNPAMHQGGVAIVSPTLTASNDPSRSPQSTEVTNQVAAIHAVSMAVRRLMPVECERLQGFPDNYTNIPWRKKPESPDGPRYKALGNSWAVPVVAWIGKRIHEAVQ